MNRILARHHVWIVAALVLLAAGAATPDSARAAGLSNGVAVAIVYDTSGSMQQKVRDADGNLTPKHVIASRALRAVLDRLEAVSSGPESSRVPIEAGLVDFHGDRAVVAVKFGRFDPQAMRTWLSRLGKPQAGTPLGDAVRLAGQAVLASPAPRKHVLVITDGVNTRGPEPTAILPKLQEAAERGKTAVSFHFVAFDVNAGAFDGVKKMGATVVGAADEKQLNSQLEFILAKKILLEDEEPTSAKPSNN